jgi:hypothetical protein
MNENEQHSLEQSDSDCSCCYRPHHTRISWLSLVPVTQITALRLPPLGESVIFWVNWPGLEKRFYRALAPQEPGTGFVLALHNLVMQWILFEELGHLPGCQAPASLEVLEALTWLTLVKRLTILCYHTQPALPSNCRSPPRCHALWCVRYKFESLHMTLEGDRRWKKNLRRRQQIREPSQSASGSAKKRTEYRKDLLKPKIQEARKIHFSNSFLFEQKPERPWCFHPLSLFATYDMTILPFHHASKVRGDPNQGEACCHICTQ